MKYNWKQFNGVGRHKGFFNKTLNNFLMLLNLASTTMGELEVLVVLSYNPKHRKNCECVTLNCQVREIFNNKKLGKSGQADRFGGAGGHPTPSLTASIYENFDPFLSYIKRQNKRSA